jgi:Zinc dependent phospholipase C
VKLRILIYALPLVVFAPDALAWGLQTHLFFAQYALMATPLADLLLRRAALRLPRLVLAGACLPDLALVGPVLGTPAFRRSHRWTTLRRIAAVPLCDEDRAIVFGYASHLLADVVAHNYFVPEHERRLARVEHLTHAACEWAMDDFLGPWVCAAAVDLLVGERAALADFVGSRFRCGTVLARRAVELLGRADGALRATPLPGLCRRALRLFDRGVVPRFEAYVRETSARLGHLEQVLNGAEPDWDAEPVRDSTRRDFWCRGRLLLPAKLL